MSFIAKLTLFVVLSAFAAVGARAGEPQPWRGIFCDTQAQVERVVAVGTKLGGAQQGIEAVNLEVGGTTQACVVGVIVGIKGETVSTIESPEGFLDVVPWQVMAILTPQGLMPLAEPITWYTLAGSTARGA